MEPNCRIAPVQTGLLLEAVISGAGLLETAMVFEAVAVHVAASVRVTVYTPAEAGSAGNPGGSSTTAVYPLGPDHANSAYGSVPPEGVEFN